MGERGVWTARRRGQRVLARVRGDDALDQGGLDRPRLAGEAERRVQPVAHDGLVGAPAALDLARVEAPHVPVQRVPPVLRHVEGLVLVDEHRHGVGRREQLEQRELGLGGAEGLGGADAEERPEHLHHDGALARALRAPDAEDRVVAEGLVDAGLERRREEPAEDGQDDLGRVELEELRQHERAKKMGYRVQETREGETIRMVLVKRTY